MKMADSDNDQQDQIGHAGEPRPPALPEAFLFVENPADFRDPASAVVRIPRGIRSKQKLFSIFSTALRFPSYFGWNWDAFEECLTDLSWLRADQPVLIIHEDLPFGSGGENRGIYLAVLRHAAKNKSCTGNHVLRVVLPSEFQAELAQ
jgi:hypothetical protein